MSGKKGMIQYPKEVKLEAVRMFFEEGVTRAEIAKALSLRSAGRVEVWTRQYRCEWVAAFTKPIGRTRKAAESEQAELVRLRMENTLLSKYHTELRMEMLAKRNIGLSTNTEKNKKLKQCVASSRFREPPITNGSSAPGNQTGMPKRWRWYEKFGRSPAKPMAIAG